MSFEREVYLKAAEISDAEQRKAYLDDACPDAEFRARIEEMLAFDPDQSFLNEDELSLDKSDNRDMRPDSLLGAKIGRYRLVSVIGEGGFGIVYEAEQTEPVERKVALKVVKLGMDTQQVIRRFETERQVLALMDHPNIAKVFDGGATEGGRPYFVMEIVDGQPITEYCDQQKLTLKQRLGLMSQLCRGVQHAHQKGIIHRDIKPSNVLVATQDGEAVPKIIDFGIAKATQHRLTERTHFSETRQFLGTPSYMSPEQTGWNDSDIDTRSDVYSLGVLLYELLTGTTPITDETMRNAAFDEVCRLIREETFPLPSARIRSLGNKITTVAANRGIGEQNLRDTPRGELDWIVMKAIEKDRQRRYDSAADFAIDIDNYLDQKPIQAAPPSLAYRTKKYLQRNWQAALLIGALTSSLLLGTVFSVSGFLAASREVERSRRNLYASDVALSLQALQVGNGRLAEELLDNHVEPNPEKDLRTFPWHYMKHQLNRQAAVMEHGSPVHDVFFAENDKYIVSAGEAGRVVIWDAKTHEEIRLIQSEISSVLSATMIGDSLYLGGRSQKALTSPGAIEHWDWKSAEKKENLELGIDFEGVVCVRRIPHTNHLLLASLNKVAAYDFVQRSVIWQDKPGSRGLRGGAETRAAAVSPDGRHIATSAPITTSEGGRRTGLVWLDAANGVRIAEQDFSSARTVCFSRDSKLAAVGRIVHPGSPPIHIIDVETKTSTPLNTLAVESATFSPTGDIFAALNWRGQLVLWDTSLEQNKGWKELCAVPAHANAPGNIGFSVDGRSIVTCGQDGNVKVWNVSDIATPHSVHATGPFGSLRDCVFSSDGQWMVSSAGQPVVRELPKLWNVATGALIREFEPPKDANGWAPTTIFSSDDKLLAGFDGDQVFVWDVSSGELRNRFEAPSVDTDFMVFSNDDKELTVGGIKILEVGRYELRSRRWDLANESFLELPPKSIEIPEAALREEELGYPHYRITGGRGPSIRLSPDRRLFAADFGSEVLLGEVETGKLLHQFTSMKHVIVPIEFSADGKYLAAAGQSQEIRVWRTDTGEETEFEAPSWAGALAFAPDGTTLAAGYYDGSIGFWDLRVEREILHLEGHPFPVTNLRFSNDGTTLVSGGWNEHVRIWRTQ